MTEDLIAQSGCGSSPLLRILAAYNLRDWGSRLPGDVFDLSVTVRVGLKEHKAPTVNDCVSFIQTRAICSASVVFATMHAQEYSYAATFFRIWKNFAEFVATFALVFTIGRCVLIGSTTLNATATACILIVMIYATGLVVGDNLNPVVSPALGLAGSVEWPELHEHSLSSA